MDLREGIRKANQILVEERRAPTVRYSLKVKERKPENQLSALVDAVAIINEHSLLQGIRARRPREIVEGPWEWAFESVNYNLLCALLSQLEAGSRPAFFAALLARLAISPGCEMSTKQVEPSWNGLVSEFPLVAEFCVRNGARGIFLRSMGEANPMPGHAVMLRHIEDMVALNFILFSESDYDGLATAVSTLAQTAHMRLEAVEAKTGGHRTTSEGQAIPLCKEIIAAAAGIKEECRKAKYLYLKGQLLDGLNLEVNQDKEAVENYLKGQGFSQTLLECLNEADRLLHGAPTGFVFKSAMGHLRSFIETLHSEGLARLVGADARGTGTRWGDSLTQLRQRGVLTKAEEAYAAALFTLLSDTGVHPAIAEKEYARLARNEVVEYALLFLTRLEKVGQSVAKLDTSLPKSGPGSTGSGR